MPPDTPLRVAVIGAGITGLAAAHRLTAGTLETAKNGETARNRETVVTVLEASGRTGGIIRTEHRDGFLMELGPDSFITNKPGAVQLCDEVGFTDQLIPTDETWRRSLVLRNGRPLPVPEGFLLMAPSSPWAIVTTPILSPLGRLRLLAEALVRPRLSGDDESLASFVRRRFGRQTLDRLVQPLVGGIYTSDPEKLSLLATLPRFPELERVYGSVIRGTLAQQRQQSAARRRDAGGSGARYHLFLTARDGLSQLTDAVTRACTASGRVTLTLNCRVSSVAPQNSAESGEAGRYDADPREQHRRTGWCVSIEGEPLPRQFDAVILTLPTHQSARLLSDDRCAELRTALQAIPYASSAIVVTGHDLSDFDHPLDAFGLVVPHIERRSVLAVSFSSRKFPGRAPKGKILLRTFIGGAMQPELLQQDDTALRALTDRELRSLLKMKRSPQLVEVVRYSRAMPQYHVGHLDSVARIEQLSAHWPGLELAGSAYHGVGIPDSIASGRAAADRVLAARTA